MLWIQLIIFFAAFICIVLLTMHKASQENKERLDDEWKEEQEVGEDGEIEDVHDSHKMKGERGAFVKKEELPGKEEEIPLIAKYVKQLPTLKQMVIYQEILGKPVALRRHEPYESE